MAKISIFNIGKANAEINAGHEAADLALVAAKITTLKVDGKDVPSADAPLALKIAAVSALVSSGDKTQDVSELIASNGQIAAQVEGLTGQLVAANATIAASTQKITTLESELVTSQSSVQTLTADLTTHKNLLDASNKEATRLTAEYNSANTAISTKSVAWNALTLVGEDGKPLAKDASQEAKLAAANKVPITEKLNSIGGVVTHALQSAGVRADQFISTPPNGSGVAAPKMSREEFHKLEPKAQTAFFNQGGKINE